MSRSLDPVADAAFILADKVRAERDEAIAALRACEDPLAMFHISGWPDRAGVRRMVRGVLAKHPKPDGGAT